MITITYANSLENEFTNWDDEDLIVNNHRIRSLDLENIKKIFTFKFEGGTYQPFRVLSYAIDYRFWKFNPVGYHLHSIFLHMIASIFLYLSFIRVLPQIRHCLFTGTVRQEEKYVLMQLTAFLTALLFAIHPVNVEAVTWLSSRKYVLLGAFSFSSFYFFIRSSEADSYNFFYNVISILLFIAAAFSSPFGVVLPGLFFLFLYCRDNSHNPIHVVWKNRKALIFYIVIGTIVFLMLWYRLVGHDGAVVKFHYGGKIWNTLVSMLQMLFDYARNFLCPLWLNNRYVDYTYTSFWNIYKIPSGLILIVALLIFVLWSWKKGNKVFLFCLGWFVISWLPASNIIPISTMMADRYIYIGSAGCFLAASYGLILGFSYSLREPPVLLLSNLISFKWFQCLFLVLIIAAVVSCVTLTIKRNRVWNNSGTLWTDSLKKDNDNFMAYTNLGTYLYKKRGDADKALEFYAKAHRLSPGVILPLENSGYVFTSIGKYEKAIPAYKKILEIDPEYLSAHGMLGQIYYLQGNYEQASYHFSKVLETEAVNGAAMTLRGNALYNLGHIDEAIELYLKGVELYPDNAELAYNLGIAYSKQNTLDMSIKFLKNAIDLKPSLAEAYNELGLVFEKKGELGKAEDKYKKALQLNAGIAEVYNNLGNIMFARENLDEAVKYYKKALLLNNDLINTRYNLCVIHEKKGLTGKAFTCYENLNKQWPDHAESLNNMGSIMANSGKFELAEQYFRQAIQQKPEYSQPYLNVAELLKNKGDIQKALEYYKKFSKRSNNISALREIGLILDSLKEADSAINIFKKITAMSEATADDLYNLGVLYSKNGKNKDAYLMFQRALKMDPDNKNANTILKRIVIEKREIE